MKRLRTAYVHLFLVHLEVLTVLSKLQAITCIDSFLDKHKRLDLIIGQPLRLKKKRVPKIPKPPKTIPSEKAAGRVHSFSGDVVQANPASTSAKPTPAAIPVTGGSSGKSVTTIPTDFPRPIAGPSKRPSPANEEPLRNKKARQADATLCAICGCMPHHLIKDCPKVTAGPKR